MGNGFGLLDKVLNFSAERYFRSAGDLFVYEGDYESALHMINKTLELEPNDVRALVLKGDILFCLNFDQEALTVLDKALTLHPENAEAFISKAGVLDVLNRHREALACCKKAMTFIGPGTVFLLPTLYDQTLSLLLRLRKAREAQQLLKEAEDRLPQDEVNYLLSCYKPLIQQACRQRRNKTDRRGHLNVLEGGAQ